MATVPRNPRASRFSTRVEIDGVVFRIGRSMSDSEIARFDEIPAGACVSDGLDNERAVFFRIIAKRQFSVFEVVELGTDYISRLMEYQKPPCYGWAIIDITKSEGRHGSFS